MQLVQKAKGILSDVKAYWKKPMTGRHMTFREIAAYSGGGIGAYMIITIGTACLLGVNNTLISSTLGVDPTDMYVMYVISVLANIPLTGVRANIIDNTRNKAGKYRPYIVSMALPTAIVCILMVWFPYNMLESILGQGTIFGESKAYVAKCALIMLFNFILLFFYYFFYDAYENLIHVLSPNSQERADVSAVKSVVYSFAPSLVNLFTPIIAKNIFHSNSTDIRVYRLLYPILGVFGILLCIVVYKYTEEKIIQAKTHVVQIKFLDALKAVAKNKYFWIISLATWIGFLEASYSNILYWLYNYGGAASGDAYGIIVTLYGNSALWGMLLAPICIRKWGKKTVLVVTNIFNIIFILLMLPATSKINGLTIWLVLMCLYLNGFVGAFAHILNPSIQADIRDYQQYKTGERIDGMFSAVSTIGTVIALLTSSVLPVIYEKGGITKENAIAVTSNPEILNRMLGDGKTVGEILSEQLANGQDNYTNSYSALYDTNILINLLHVLIIVSAVGALLNVIPYLWYDFNEKKQKFVVRVLKVRALFEDYGNGVLNDGDLVEAIDIINETRELQNAEITEISKDYYRKIKDEGKRIIAKKQYREILERNENIEIAAMVGKELVKFQTPFYQAQLRASKEVYAGGLAGLLTMDIGSAKEELATAKAMPKDTEDEKEYRSFAIQFAKNKITACKEIEKHFSNGEEFKEPDYSILEGIFERQDNCDIKLSELSKALGEAKAAKDSAKAAEIKAEIKDVTFQRKVAKADEKEEVNRHVIFNRAAKPYMDAKRIIEQSENYTHLDEIEALYDEAKARYEAKLQADADEIAAIKAEEEAMKAKIREEKAAKKAAKKASKKK